MCRRPTPRASRPPTSRIRPRSPRRCERLWGCRLCGPSPPNRPEPRMSIQVTMPRLSDTMEQGTVVKWNVKEGQRVKSGDVVADIETDKATMELQSFDDGTVAKLAVPEGQAVKVGTVIMVLAGDGESVEQAGASAAKRA